MYALKKFEKKKAEKIVKLKKWSIIAHYILSKYIPVKHISYV